MSQNILNDISKVYLEKIALDEAVRGADNELRRAASQERQTEKTTEKDYRTKGRSGNTKTGPKLSTTPHPKSVVKNYADQEANSIAWHDKKSKGKFIPGMVKNEALDPVGQEDADIDNDGKKNTKSDKYLTNRRKVRGASIKKESFSNWRQDLVEVIDKIQKEEEEDGEIKEKKIKNKIIINPEFKEAVEELGGVLLETVEVEEGYKPINKEKESAMYRRAGNLARTSLSSRGKKKEETQTKSSKIVSAITRQKENERFDRIGQSPAHNEEFVSEEDPCWDTHKQVGMKKKGNRMVPNCVPKTESVNPAQQAAIAIAMKKSGKKPKNEEVEVIDEKTRYAKETGKSFRTGKPVTPGGTAKNDNAFQKISKLMGSGRAGVQPRGQKKVPGKKKPSFGQSPAQRVANRRASAQSAQDMMHSKFD